MLLLLAQQTWQQQLIGYELFWIVFALGVLMVLYFIGVLIIADSQKNQVMKDLKARLELMEKALPTTMRLTGIEAKILHLTKTVDTAQRKMGALLADTRLLQTLSATERAEMNKSLEECARLLRLSDDLRDRLRECNQDYETVMQQHASIRGLQGNLAHAVERLNTMSDQARDTWQNLSALSEELERRTKKRQEELDRQMDILQSANASRKEVKKALGDLKSNYKRVQQLEQLLASIDVQGVNLELQPIDGDVEQRLASLERQVREAAHTANTAFNRLMRMQGDVDDKGIVPPQLASYEAGGARFPSEAREVLQDFTQLDGSPLDPSLAVKLDESLELEPDQVAHFDADLFPEPPPMPAPPPQPMARPSAPRPPQPRNKNTDITT